MTALADQPVARKCVRCGHTTTPRGDVSPSFCAVCGHRLKPIQTQHPFTYEPTTLGRAVAALVLGLFAFVPMCGFVPGVLAVGCGLSARNQIERYPTLYRGKGLATAGITLGILGCILWTVVCFGVR